MRNLARNKAGTVQHIVMQRLDIVLFMLAHTHNAYGVFWLKSLVKLLVVSPWTREECRWVPERLHQRILWQHRLPTRLPLPKPLIGPLLSALQDTLWDCQLLYETASHMFGLTALATLACHCHLETVLSTFSIWHRNPVIHYQIAVRLRRFRNILPVVVCEIEPEDAAVSSRYSALLDLRFQSMSVR